MIMEKYQFRVDKTVLLLKESIAIEALQYQYTGVDMKLLIVQKKVKMQKSDGNNSTSRLMVGILYNLALSHMSPILEVMHSKKHRVSTLTMIFVHV